MIDRRISIRLAKNAIMTALMLAAAIICVFPLLDILFRVFVRGLPAMSLATLLTPTTGIAGGLSNAIAGTLLIVAVALVLSGPIGILGALYTSEFASPRFAAFVRYTAELLTGVPSIVLGYFGYVTLVVALGWGFSLLAAALTLMIMMVPYILRSTDLAMQRVSDELRYASLSLGATEVATAFRIVMRGAIPGIATGLMLAAGIAVGETAPLIYTAGFSNYLPTGQLFHSPVGYLTYVIWTYINQPFDSAHRLAYAAAFVLIVIVLCINMLGRWILKRHSFE